MDVFGLRTCLRNTLFQCLSAIINHPQGKTELVRSLAPMFRLRPSGLDDLSEPPYQDLGKRSLSTKSQGEGAIFVTARFRSGSTLLWNLLRQFPQLTAYYEPFNERRWFDPSQRGDNVDATHRGVSDYWKEYEGLEDLATLYDENWIRDQLYMDQHSWHPKMRQFIQRLIDHAPERAVLQFNRLDFRLPWIREQFPKAKIIHLYRHPREQWCSTLQHSNQFGPESGALSEFQPYDHFYLIPWVKDLRYRIAILDDDESRHPYYYFYLIWRLSHTMGVQNADVSISFEQLSTSPKQTLQELARNLHLGIPSLETLVSMVRPPTPEKWKSYASDDWFAQIESECEDMLAEGNRVSEQTKLRIAG